MLIMFNNTSMAALLLAVAMLYSCRGIQGDCSTASRYKKLRAYADEINAINTHEHQRWISAEIPATIATFFPGLDNSMIFRIPASPLLM